MNIEAIQVSVEQHFDYLFKKHNFVVCNIVQRTGMGGWEILLKSPKLQIKLETPRGEIYLWLAPLVSDLFPDPPWIVLETVLTFLENTPVFWYEEQVGSLSKQLSYISSRLAPYYEQIQELFESENFVVHYPELQLAYNRLIKRQFQDILSRKT